MAKRIDNGTPRDTSPVNDNNTNMQMPEVNVTVSSDNYKYNEQDKKTHKNHIFKHIY